MSREGWLLFKGAATAAAAAAAATVMAAAAPPVTAPPVAAPEQPKCSVCLDASPEVVLLDCGHVCCCAECATQLRACPICRARIVRVQRIYNA